MSQKTLIKKASGFLRSSLNKFRQQPYVFILGMHRSGTSSLSGMLKSYGLYLGPVSHRNLYNLKGNQEGYAVSINEILLKANGGSWHNPTVVSHISWKEQLLIERLRLQMSFDLMRTGHKKWGAKDPRMLFCLPAWEEKNIQYVGTFRHPVNVVQSLKARNGEAHTAIDWMELWYRYNVQLMALYRKRPFPIVNFDWEPSRYRKAVRNVATHLELASTEEDFFDDKLRHQQSDESIESEKHRDLYEKLVSVAETEEKKLISSIDKKPPR